MYEVYFFIINLIYWKSGGEHALYEALTVQLQGGSPSNMDQYRRTL